MDGKNPRAVHDPRIALLFHLIRKNLHAPMSDVQEAINMLADIDAELEALKSPKNEPRKDS